MIRTLLYIVFCTSVLTGFGQHYPHKVPQYYFVNYDDNIINNYGDSSIIEGFYDKLDTLIFDGNGSLNIVHIGGSHIQAGVWSREMREQLSQFAPGLRTGRGLVFPYNLAKTNNPYDYLTRYSGGSWVSCKNTQRTKSCELGLMGYSATTYSSSSKFRVYTKGDKFVKYYFNRVKVFHETDSSSYDVVLQYPDSLVTRRVDVLGGFTEFVFPSNIDTVRLALKKSTPRQNKFKLMGFNLEEDDKHGIYYHGIGVNGAAIPAYLRTTQLERQLTTVKPDLVVLSIGINDAYGLHFSKENYKKHYRQLIARIRKVAPNTAILFTTNNDSYYKRRYANKNGILVKEAMDELSKELGASVWDVFTVMGGLNSINTWVKYRLARTDRIHFKREGYVFVAQLMYDAIIQSYNDHLKKKYTVD